MGIYRHSDSYNLFLEKMINPSTKTLWPLPRETMTKGNFLSNYWSTRPTLGHGRYWSLFSQFFQNIAKQNKFQANTMFTTGETMGLAEWIIDDTCLVFLALFNKSIPPYSIPRKTEKNTSLANSEWSTSKHQLYKLISIFYFTRQTFQDPSTTLF